MWLVVAIMGFSGERSRIRALGHHNLGLRGAVSSFRWRNLETESSQIIIDLKSLNYVLGILSALC